MNAWGIGSFRSGWRLCALLAAAAFQGCGSNGPEPENRPPTVKLTSGPVEGETVSYSIDIGWEGHDPDGLVQRFEYAVDPPADFTEEEIASGGPGVGSEIIPGTGGGSDLTRITKIVDGTPVSFDWVHTTRTSHHFVFQTAEAESLDLGGYLGPTGRFTGMHAVYVRAVDNDAAVSLPDHVAFTAESVAPTAMILGPDISSGGIVTGLHPVIRWTGTDPDGPPPIGYLYKLIWRVPIPDLPMDCRLFLESNSGWTYQSAENPDITLDLEHDGDGVYAFGVRAVDEAGAVEPFVDCGRNAFAFIAHGDQGYPLVTLTCLTGTYVFRGDAQPVSVDVPAGRDLECEVSCSAETYGETCADMRWGLDLADLDVEAGWSPWSTDFTLGPIQIPNAGIHVLYVQVRDSAGNSTLATLILDVADISLDREILWVDDSRDDTYPNDSEHDAFWRRMFSGYPGLQTGDVSEFHSFGDNDRGFLHPRELHLSDLGRYRLLVWENRGYGFDGDSGLLRVTAKPALALYLAAGGKLWLGGQLALAATVPDASGVRGDFIYPKELRPGQFAWDYLKLHTTRVNNDKGTFIKNNLYTARPFPGRPETYPQLSVDPLKQSAGLQGLGITHSDAVFDPIFVNAEAGFRGTLDSLYVYGATGNEIQGKPSTYHNRLLGVRWHDPDPAREQGRIQWFGFALYYFNDSEAQETLNRSLDWFREEAPPTVP